jgi:alkylation response protein AidB-like acyl-CoA dehydrogenase
LTEADEVDFNLSDEQQMLRDGVRRFVREQYGFEARRALAKGADGYSREHWHTFADLGWLALGLPEDVGGLGCSFVETAILLEEFGRGLVLEPYVSTAVLCARILERCGNRELRADRLSHVATGELILALAHDEPGSRFDPERAGATARPAPEGFVLEGTKTLVLDGAAADQFIVSAAVSGDHAPSLFLVPRSAASLDVRSYPLIDGSRAADLHLRGVVCPPGARLAGPEQGADLLGAAFDASTMARIAEAIGAMESVMRITSEYLKTRVQFGQAIGKFQALQHRMAEMFVEVQESRSALYRGMAYLDADPAARRAAVSAAKVVVGDAARFVGGQGIQLHGGIGITEEYSVGHYFRKLAAFEKIHGDSDWHLDRFIAGSR